jgi:hypothetical protein
VDHPMRRAPALALPVLLAAACSAGAPPGEAPPALPGPAPAAAEPRPAPAPPALPALPRVSFFVLSDA